MACGATLKRSLEFDPVHSPGRSPKRLCMPKDLLSPAAMAKQQHTPAVATNANVCEATHKFVNSHFISRHNLSSPPHSPASRDCVQHTLSACQSSTSIQDFPSPASKSSMNLSVRTCTSSSSQTTSKEQPLFTLSQVDIICRRVVQEHEELVREQFDRVLAHKLSEQYEAFLKFNHDQLKRRFENPINDCSYVS